MGHRTRIALAIALQLLILVGIAGARQWTLMTGAVVLLEVLPVDPRDLFRGEYVALQYRISSLVPGALGATETFRVGQTVYVGLGQRGTFWHAVSVGSTRPAAPFIRGVVVWHPGRDALRVQYGIESYFLQEGLGRRVETSRVPLSAEVVIGRDGTAIIQRLFMDGQPVQ